MQELELATAIVQLGAAITTAIVESLRNGDVTTLVALGRAVPTPEVLAARDAALVAAQRAKAREALGGSQVKP